MAITLLDIQRTRKDEYEKGVIETFVQECDISKKLPLVTIGTLEVHTKRTNSIPTVGFRKRGEGFGSVAAGGTDAVSDAVYAMGANIDIDKTDMRDKAVTNDPMTERTKAAVKGMAWTFNDAFINGDHGVDEDSFEGIKVRMATLNANQTIYANNSTTAVDLQAAIAASTTATLQTFLDKIDETIYTLDGHRADVCLTGADFIRSLKAVLRRLNLYKDVDPSKPFVEHNQRMTSAEMYSRPSFVWNGVDFYDMGFKADQVNQIIATETIGSACRPAYFLKLGAPYFHGIQQYAMEVGKPTLLDDQVTYRTVIDWPVGLRHVHTRPGAKLAGYKVA